MTKAEMKHQEATEALAVDEEMTEAEELDLMTGFLKAAENITEKTKKIQVKDGKTVLFSFRVHALTEADSQKARKMATTYMPNPKNKKLPQIAKDVSETLYKSCIIYLATTDEDRQRVWDNKQFKDKFNVMMGYELVDKVFSAGFKDKVIEVIDELSGYGSDGEDEPIGDIDTAKN